MTPTSRVTILAWVLLAVLPTWAQAGEAAVNPEEAKVAEVFESLWGADLKRVKGTRDPKDDVELAGRLLEAAKAAEGQPAFLAVLCQHACELGSLHPTGYATAARAAELLAAKAPDRAGASAGMIVDIRQKQFDAATGNQRTAAGEAVIDALMSEISEKVMGGAFADAATLCHKAQVIARSIRSQRRNEVEAWAKVTGRTLKAFRDVEALEKAPDADSAKVRAARETLVLACVVDLDDPAAAARHLEGVEDAALRKYVPAAARPVEEAPPLACLELGDWYRGLAEKADPLSRAAMLARAQGYYLRCVETHKEDDLDHIKATAALQKVDADLRAAGRSPFQRVLPWTDVLAMADPKRDTVQGTCQRQGSSMLLVSQKEMARLMIPLTPKGDYELRIRFVRTTGGDTIGFTLPVGPTSVGLLFSFWWGEACGLGCIKGQDPRNNASGVKPGRIENGREYVVQCKVAVEGATAEISATLDGKPYIAWRGPVADLSVFNAFTMPKPECLGMGACNATMDVRSLRLRMLSGEARPVAPGPKPSPAKK